MLFVAAAGNSNSDIGFARLVPADIDLPNVLTRMSGTSMVAQQVTNLAAKLFARYSKLMPGEVIKLILDGATKSSDGKRLLINAKASVVLLEARH